MSELWATSSIHMNDAKEFERGREVITQELTSLPDDRTKNTMRTSIKDADPLEVYCTCFSAVGDDLSQWRGYGDNRAGVCIEFDLDRLRQDLEGIGYWVIYGKVTNQATQTAVARELLSSIHFTITNGLPPLPVPDAVFREVREQLAEIWPAVFLAFKHLDFEAEKEFRFVYSQAIDRLIVPSFRPRPIVPYVKLRMRSGAQLPITAVRLGPAANSDANVESLKLALRHLNLSHIAVTKSEIPYVPR